MLKCKFCLANLKEVERKSIGMTFYQCDSCMVDAPNQPNDGLYRYVISIKDNKICAENHRTGNYIISYVYTNNNVSRTHIGKDNFSEAVKNSISQPDLLIELNEKVEFDFTDFQTLDKKIKSLILFS